ncbi:MAG: YicC family protein [candidate division KSB1 bacterium]|nr:YicC family protein [candidate division KSB1 bacterium]
MTGYGRGEVKRNGIEVAVEVRSLNNRFLDITVRLPKSLAQCEAEIKEIVKAQIVRGRVSVSVSLNYETGDSLQNIKLDLELAQKYWQLLQELKSRLGINEDLKLGHLLNLPNIFVHEEEEEVKEDVWECVSEALTRALEDLKKMRLKEGEELFRDLTQRIATLDKNIIAIENISKEKVNSELAKLKERVKDIAKLESIDQGRLELEVALLADRVDVTEECIRFKSHNKLFLDTLNQEEAVGRRLNFLLQEMNREANTIGAKASDAAIAHLVVQIKEEVEKIREQVQNIE